MDDNNRFPEYLLGDNSDFPEGIFVIHTTFPRFIINITNDDIEWLEEFDEQDRQELSLQAEQLIAKAYEFYDREINQYDD